MMVQPLPYDMGNAGDLLKHALLAEFTQWWCGIKGKPIRFIDPFGGRPWIEPPVETVTKRVKALSDIAVSAVQPHPEKRYYGSAHIVRHAAAEAGHHAYVSVSDLDPAALRDLVISGLKELSHPEFDPADGYSILRAQIDADLILIDPFESFVSKEAPAILPQISKVSGNAAVVLFVLIRDRPNAEARRYVSLKAQHLRRAWSLRCPPLRNTGVNGEADYSVEVLLIAPELLMEPAATSLSEQLKRYAKRLTEVLGARVVFSAG
jgi:hypothetical protein